VAQAGWLGPDIGGCVVLWLHGAVLYSSHELSELSQQLCHDDSTIDIVLSIIIVIL